MSYLRRLAIFASLLAAATVAAAPTVVLETPLNSLFVPRTCPNGKPAHVSWKFCPWGGERL
jgi:hypothetical protein